jgi:transmembrane sensor
MNNSTEKKARRIATLLAGYMRKNLTPAEHDELDEWVGASDKNMRLFEELTDERNLKKALEIFNDNNHSGLVKKLKEDNEYKYPNHRPYRRIIQIGIAASIALALGTGIYFYPTISGKLKSSGEIAKSNEVIPLPVAPAKQTATLYLGNDQKIALDKAKSGYIANQGDIIIEQTGGEIRYSLNQSSQITESRNTLSTGKGEYFDLILPDGTVAKLNSGSSISYPVPFLGKIRRVSITGEVFFKVASSRVKGPNYGKPFIADITDKNQTVEVLGTEFNVNAYLEEKWVKTTLFEGSVKVSAGGKTGFLKPGQEAQVGTDGNIAVKEVDANDAILWMKNIVRADQEDLMPALNELCRRYNVELAITPEAKNIRLTSSITGSHSLDKPLESILEEMNNTAHGAHFELKGRKIQVTVTPS